MVYCQQLERAQRKFLGFAGYKLNISHPPRHYDSVLQNLNLSSLADRHLSRDLIFLQNLINDKTDSPHLLQHVNFRVPARPTRYIAPVHRTVMYY